MHPAPPRVEATIDPTMTHCLSKKSPRRVAWALLASALAFAPTGACQGTSGRPGAPWSGLFSRLVPYVLGDRAERQWDHVSEGDPAACRAALRAAGTRFRSLPDRPTPDRQGCGIPHGVIVTRGPTGIVYDAPLRVDCSLAARLPEVETAIQAAAMGHLGQRIRRIGTFGSYSCRPIRGRASWLSEHAFGNAIDLARFTPRRGPSAVVARDYDLGLDAPRGPRGRFLRDLEGRLRALDGISRVIGPRHNAAHRDHFHLDRGWQWWRRVDFLGPG